MPRPFAILLAALLLSACGDDDTPSESDAALPTVTVWAHKGKEREYRTLQAQVEDFNADNDDVQVELVLIEEQGYDQRVKSARADGSLPCLLDFDGPFLANYAWIGVLRPLDDYLDEELLDRLLPSIRTQGTYAGRFWGVGTFDSGLGLYGNQQLLRSAGVRIPEGIDEAWTAAEFIGVLDALRARDEDGQVLDLHLDYQGEWFSYGFSPVLQSAGGDLVARGQPPRAAGTLDSDDSIAAMAAVQDWIGDGYVDPNSDGQAFTASRVALSWSGHWDYPRYHEALGADLLVLPLPDFGDGPRTGQGSWAWGITTGCPHPELAARFLRFLLDDEEVLRMSDGNGAVPATTSALGKSERYGADGALRLFGEQLQAISVPRPVTPAYPVITQSFQDAFQTIRRGGDVGEALREAARRIDRDIDDNQGYPAPE